MANDLDVTLTWSDGAEWDGDTAQRVTRVLEKQTGAALKMFGVGCWRDPDTTTLSFAVTNNGDGTVRVAAGAGIGKHSTKGYFGFESTAPAAPQGSYTNNSANNWIHAIVEIDTNDTRETLLPKFVVTGSSTNADGITLARVTLSGGAVTTITDLREEITIGAAGDAVGPSSSTDNAIARWDGTTGKLLQDGPATLSDTGALTVPEISAPSTPASGKVVLYAKTDGHIYSKDDAGTETQLGVTTSGDMLKSVYDVANDGKIDLAAGGTGAGTAADARTNLGLGTASTKDYPASGNASGSQVVIATDTRLTDARTPSTHTHAASAITSGTIDQDRLGTDSGGTGTKFLADDQTYKSHMDLYSFNNFI